MSKRKFITGGTLFLAALAAGVFVLLPALHRPATTWTLPDGSTLRLRKVTTGTNHVFNYGQKLKDYLYPVVPAAYRSNFNFQITRISTPPGGMVLWLEHTAKPGSLSPALHINLGSSRVYLGGGSREPGYFFSVFDADGHESDPVPAMNMVPLANAAGLDAVLLHQYPHRARSLGFRIYELPDVFKRVATFRLRNPAPSNPPNWSPEPLPTTRRTNGLEVTLVNLEADGWRPTPLPATLPGDWRRSLLRATLEIREQGRLTTDWMVSGVTLTNATGADGLCSDWDTPLAAIPATTPPKPPAPGDGEPISPIMQVGDPNMITPPCTVGSPSLAAGRKLIRTPSDPMTIMSGGPTQVAIVVTVAAGRKSMRTVGAPGGRIGPPTCGTNTVTIGQVCISVTLAAGGIRLSL